MSNQNFIKGWEKIIDDDSNNYQLMTNLRFQLGSTYNIKIFNKTTIVIDLPITNEIDDNYRIFIKKLSNHRYQLDDDGDAISEFEMYNLKRDLLNMYLKINHIKISNHDVIKMIANQNNLIDVFYQMIRILTGITAIQQVQSRLQHVK